MESSKDIKGMLLVDGKPVVVQTSRDDVSNLPDDYRSHHADWVGACEIARKEAKTDADRTYWEHQLNTLNKINEGVARLYGNEISGTDGSRLLPNDYYTHHRDWVAACRIALEVSSTDADKSYWKHQSMVLERVSGLVLGERILAGIRTGLSSLGPESKSSYVVLKIEETGNAAFVDVGRDQEIARIIEEAATSMDAQPSIMGFSLRDLNGNRVGLVDVTTAAPTDDMPFGMACMSIETSGAAFDDHNDGVGEVAAIFRKAAEKIRSGEQLFTLHDHNGNQVGVYEYVSHPSLAKDGVINMREALDSGRVYLAEGGYTGLAEDSYRFVVTTPDFEPGYHQDSGEVWLVNAKGEIAEGYEEPQEVRETMFSELRGDQKKDLREVAEGRMSAEDFERRYGDDNDLELS